MIGRLRWLRKAILSLAVFLHLDVQRIVLIDCLLFLLSVVLGNVVVAVLSTIVFARLLHAVCFLPWVTLRFFLHNSNGLIVVEDSLLLVILGIVVCGFFGVVTLFFICPFWPIISFFVAPADGEGTGTPGSLHDLLVCLAVEVGIVCHVFVQHFST